FGVQATGAWGEDDDAVGDGGFALLQDVLQGVTLGGIVVLKPDESFFRIGAFGDVREFLKHAARLFLEEFVRLEGVGVKEIIERVFGEDFFGQPLDFVSPGDLGFGGLPVFGLSV